MDKALLWVMEEGMAKDSKVMLPSNKRADRIVTTDEWKEPEVRSAIPFWTGTLWAFNKPGETLGTVLEFTPKKDGLTYVIDVPLAYQGQRDIALVFEYPNHGLSVDRGRRVVIASKVDVVSLPTKSGWYPPEPKHGIPSGDAVGEYDPDARYLPRPDGPRVELIVRYAGGEFSRVVGRIEWHDPAFGMLVM